MFGSLSQGAATYRHVLPGQHEGPESVALPVSRARVRTCQELGRVVTRRCVRKIVHHRKLLSETGAVTTRMVELTVDIKPGTPTGTRFVFEGMGNAVPGEMPGPAVYTLSVKPHERFSRSGADLHHTVLLPVKDALTGTILRLEHLDGRILEVRLAMTGVTEARMCDTGAVSNGERLVARAGPGGGGGGAWVQEGHYGRGPAEARLLGARGPRHHLRHPLPSGGLHPQMRHPSLAPCRMCAWCAYLRAREEATVSQQCNCVFIICSIWQRRRRCCCVRPSCCPRRSRGSRSGPCTPSATPFRTTPRGGAARCRTDLRMLLPVSMS